MPRGNDYLDGIDAILGDRRQITTNRIMTECSKCHNITEESSRTTPKLDKSTHRGGGLAFLGPTCKACKEAELIGFQDGLFTENSEIIFRGKDPEDVLVHYTREEKKSNFRRNTRNP